MAYREQAPITDRALAHMASIATFIGKHVRPVGDLYMHRDPRVRRLHYGVANEFNSDTATWATYAGDPDGPKGPIQKRYRQVARTQVLAGQQLREIHQNHPDEFAPVIAWKLGKASVAGILDASELDEIIENGYYDTLLGGGEHTTTLAMMARRTRELVIPEGGVIPGPVMNLHGTDPATTYPQHGTIY
ncbi:MAG TPA: hypothetical protein VLF59_02925 [Candidatus Saccharimonadales bacterium]|nr:hypothetical protein [Candidatus Saccharimonadales bacterium]